MRRFRALPTWSLVAVAAGCGSAAAAPIAATGPVAGTGPVATANEASDAAPAPDAPPTVHVSKDSRPYIEVQPVGRATESTRLDAPAKVSFRDGAVTDVGSPVAGRVATVHVRVGDLVKAGDPLVTLVSAEAAETRADLDRAKVAVHAASEMVRRQKLALDRGVAVEMEAFEAKMKLEDARARLEKVERAQSLLGSETGETVILRAPADGVVVANRTSAGAFVERGGDGLIRVADPKAVQIVADVFDKDLPLVKAGASVDVTLEATDRPVKGHVVTVGTTVNTALRRAPVYIAVDPAPAGPGVASAGPDLALRPGAFAHVSIERDAESELSLPVSAVLVKDGKTVVYLEHGDSFSARPIEVGAADGGKVPVLGGLAFGEHVVTRGALLIDQAAEQLL